ncbi:hypothetical protein EIP91_009267 [Steccherinum ochraceum]|uniref:Uncharacterized protein n=1 Tax=Steccherinum ochraceum TaxID=92696 RepID=A0A4R0R1V3_9APHY|nr:hypothetical protein EIP91_009267 [Steccherinum ochraceum]
MQFKKNFLLFVLAAVMTTAVGALPVPTPGEVVAVSDVAHVEKSFLPIEAREDFTKRRHGDSKERGRSHDRRDDLEARRHGDSNERGRSRDRRDEIEARRHGDSRGRSHDRREEVELTKRRHGDSGERGRSRDRRDEIEARRHGDSRGRSHDRRDEGERSKPDAMETLVAVAMTAEMKWNLPRGVMVTLRREAAPGTAVQKLKPEGMATPTKEAALMIVGSFLKLDVMGILKSVAVAMTAATNLSWINDATATPMREVAPATAVTRSRPDDMVILVREAVRKIAVKSSKSSSMCTV